MSERDESGKIYHFDQKDILKATEMGLWAIRLGVNGQINEMYADDIMRRIMAVPKWLTPEECYQYWYSRINNGYYNYVNNCVQDMIRTGNIVQLQYTWRHPVHGEVKIRCTGVRKDDKDGTICVVGYHGIVNNIVETRVLQDEPSSELFEFNSQTHSIYFHTPRQLLNGSQMHEDNFPDRWIDEKIVHPHFAEEFRNIFRDVENRVDVKEMELLMKSSSGEYSWYKMTTRHLSEDECDRGTILVQLRVADQERIAELENQRIRDFYHASLSEAFAYAELDLESDQLQAAGGLWADCPNRFQGQGRKFIQFLVDCQHQYVPAKNAKNKFVTCDSVDDMYHQMLCRERGIIRYTYKRLLIQEWRWVQLTIYTFKEKYSQNMYALLYLRDIDAEKRQQEAAQTDALTGVFNRKVFEDRVNVHMKNPDNALKGAIVLMDVDNFKAVNDQYGHLVGDDVLKHMADSLEETFASVGLVGRFGGDEFFVFIENDCTRNDIDELMEHFIDLFVHGSDIPVSCSAGIAFVRDGAPSYQKILSLADEALYKSKINGKNQYHYAEEKKSST